MSLSALSVPLLPEPLQQAIIALQEKKLVWKASRGVYAVDEHVIVDLLRADGLLEGL